MYEDNSGCVKLSKEQKKDSRTKYIDIRHNFIQENVKNGQIQVEYLPTESMIADIFTKPLGRIKFEKFREALRVVPAREGARKVLQDKHSAGTFSSKEANHSRYDRVLEGNVSISK